MQNIDIIQRSIDFIEENLKTELSADEVAQQAGFSLFHYYRIFQGAIGIPVMQYVIKRKLLNAIYEIKCGEKIINVALAYGFDTHAGFFKAFKREFDCSPTEYIKTRSAKKPYKINLIQEEHIMITHKKLKEILTHWDMSDATIKDIYYDATGNKSENSWYVNDAYVIKIGTNLTGLKQHIAVSKSLSEAGLQVATPIATDDGNDYVLDNEIYYCLTNRIKGKSSKSSEMYKGDFKSKARYTGEIIGQLHLILSKYDNDIICNESNMLESVNNWAMPKVKKIMELPNIFYQDYIETFGKLFPKLPRHIIHRDPNPSNIVMTDGRLSGFIDFELSERNVRIFDPCYAATAILSESFVENDDDKMNKWLLVFKNIINGYDSVCKLSKEEKQAIPYVVFSIQMICVACFNGIDKLSELEIVNKKMLSWLYEHRDYLEVE